MNESTFDARSVKPGDVLLSVREKPVTRMEIAWYMVASYDLNPIHVDEPFARAAGFPTVIGQGMLPLGYLAKHLVAHVGQDCIRRLGGSFVNSVMPGDELVSEIRAESVVRKPDGVEVEWGLLATGTDGKVRLKGAATTWHEDAARAT